MEIKSIDQELLISVISSIHSIFIYMHINMNINICLEYLLYMYINIYILKNIYKQEFCSCFLFLFFVKN